jgi:hypothetical protein
MNRIAALSLVAFSLAFVHLHASAAEGKSSEPPPALDANRASNYSGAPASAQSSDAQTKSKPHLHANSKAIAGKVARGATTASARSSDFYIYGATSTLRSDRDGDGYHSEFRVRFDADVVIGDAYVYAKLYLRRAGESEWFLYHETDDFYINGQSPDDEYYVTTALDDGYPTGEYDVLIDLYESGFSGIVATLGPLDSGALSYLPLEEAGLDVPIGVPGYSIRDVSTELIDDADRDGHFSRFRISFDPDADTQSRVVYARIWVRARGGEWFEEYATEDFWVETSGQADEYVLSVEWRSGYPTSFYDVQIDLHDAATDLLVASAGSERPALAQIPLEDQSRDTFVNSPPPGSGGSTSSREGGGGAFEIWSLAGLLILGLARRVQRMKRRA